MYSPNNLAVRHFKRQEEIGIPQEFWWDQSIRHELLRSRGLTSEAFFCEYLEGKKSALPNRPTPEYPEITFDTDK
jgi:hypothetical protein